MSHENISHAFYFILFTLNDFFILLYSDDELLITSDGHANNDDDNMQQPINVEVGACCETADSNNPPSTGSNNFVFDYNI